LHHLYLTIVLSWRLKAQALVFAVSAFQACISSSATETNLSNSLNQDSYSRENELMSRHATIDRSLIGRESSGEQRGLLLLSRSARGNGYIGLSGLNKKLRDCGPLIDEISGIFAQKTVACQGSMPL
jgi:hypothetical protein